MASEFDFQFNAKHHQDELLAEAAAHRLIRSNEIRRETPETTGNRLQTLLRRLAGSPTFA
jgi:hypothetical protein